MLFSTGDVLTKNFERFRGDTEKQPATIRVQEGADATDRTAFSLLLCSRDNLSFADREIVTVGAISALPGCEPQLKAHVAGARNMGVTDEELRALPALLEAKSGAAEGERLRGALSFVPGDSHAVAETVDFSVWPKGIPNPYAQYFTGNSYLAQLGGGFANVTFEPGCRNNWHAAAADSWFQHLACHKDAQEGATNEWLEPVSDGQYIRLR